ncbi:MAG TPA: DUF992 domain-containing protein [Xanthobacteraceae bacterium]|nr:DUF992 domain-containing protein [Xanthobacteraceae bacterium]
MRIRLAACAAFAAALFGMGLAATTPARADTQVGLLSCRSANATSYLVVSNQPFTCVFTPTVGGPVQFYQADIRRFGAQAGFSNNTALEWAVFAPSIGVGPGALAGTYGGFSAGAAFGIGVGANGLVGGSNNSFALQPLSFEGQGGALNVVATATEVDLQAVVPAHHHWHHRHHH